MSWNYRVVKKRHTDNDTLLGIHEVYYDDNGKPIGVTEDSVDVSTDETISSIKWQLTEMLKALDRPILDYDKDFN